MAKILAVDDNVSILNLIKKILEREGHEVYLKTSLSEVDLNNINYFDLMLLDIMMPNKDGIQFLKQERESINIPVIFVTAKTGDGNLSYGLDIGADDYIEKPFSILELRSRVNAHLRREKWEEKNVLTINDVTIDFNEKIILCNKVPIRLTRSEYLICELLMKHVGMVLSKTQIHETVCNFENDSDDRSIVEHIKNIRVKLNSEGVHPIETIWGIGYKWRKKE